jgi:hypothetical protein
MNIGLASAEKQAISERLNKAGGSSLSFNSLRFGSFQKYLTKPGGNSHATL